MDKTADLPRYSVIIPTYNSAPDLQRCLEALCRQTVDQDRYEIIVVDDGSTDQTSKIAAQFPARYIHQENQGPGAARNRGAALARGEILVFVDADCEPFANWLEELVRPLSDPGLQATQGCYRTRQKSYSARFAQMEFEERYQIMLRYPAIDLIATYSAAFRKETFVKLGGFDPAFPRANNEDTELSYRFCAQGFKARLVPTALTYHQHPETPGQYFRTKFWRAYWRIMVYRRFPGKAFKDRYTTMTLKIQTLFMILSLIPVLLSLWQPVFLETAALFWVMIIVSGRRLLGICRDHSPGPGFTPFCAGMLLLRSLALGLGSIHGLARTLYPSKKHGRDIYQTWGKRALDLVLTSLILIPATPVLLTIALLVKLSSPGPVIFRQTRIGQNGRPFTIYKFRTMHPRAHPYDHSPDDDFADPRVTRIGGLLRASGLDELPQLFNILKGEMSLVGPRPEMEFIVQNYSEEARFRLRVKPGLTGLWQISPDRNKEIHHNLHYDRAYIKNISLGLDLNIIARTILLTGKNILAQLRKIMT